MGSSPWTVAGEAQAGEPDEATGGTNPMYGANPSAPAQAALSGAQNPDTSQAQTAGSTPEAPIRNTQMPPLMLRKVHTSPIARAVDKVANFLAGSTGTELYEDQYGEKHVYHPLRPRGQQWAQIAREGIAGAAEGLAAGKGAGNMGRAAAAGVTTGQQQAQQRAQQAKEMSEEARQSMLDNANNQMLRMKLAEQAWRATRLQVEATQADVQFAQSQEDRLVKEGGVVLGTAAHPGDIGDILKVNPNVMRDLVKNHTIEIVPHINPDGTPGGFKAIKMPQGYRTQIMPPGQKFPTFNEVTGDYDWHVSGDPLTAGELDDYWTHAGAEALDFKSKQAEIEQKAEADKAAKERSRVSQSEIDRNEAAAAKDRSQTVAGGTPQPVQDDMAEGLASGRYLMGKDVPLRTIKDQATAAQLNTLADQYSRQHYGLPYSPEIIRQETKMAESPHTQAFLSGIDRMIGTPGMPGQLDQVLDLAKRAGVTQKGGAISTPLSEVRQWVKQRLGVDAAKQLETNLSDTQTALGTLIGNPLLGSGESDLKLKTAQAQYGKDMTIANLEATNATVKEVLERARAVLARNNRYIQQRYGDSYSPKASTAQAFSKSAFLRANPQGNVAAAAAAAAAAGHPVVE